MDAKKEAGVAISRDDVSCPGCGSRVGQEELYSRYKVCPSCNHHASVSARERISQLADSDSFREANRFLASVDPLSFSDRVPYRVRVKEAQNKTGLTEAVVTGTGRIGGHPCVLAVLDFSFLGGSMGSVVGEKITLAFELAIREKLPLVAVVTSGGARMQEGLLSLMQMAKTAAAAKRLHEAGLLFVAVLANPTTGGTYASYASLADIILAEPGALIGFAGPRVAAQTGLGGEEGCRKAENLFRHGILDEIVERPRQREYLTTLLELTRLPYRLVSLSGREYKELPLMSQRPPWETLQTARHRDRPTAMDYIQRLTANFVELHGDRLYGDDGAIVCGLGDLSGLGVVVIGQERGHDDGQQGRNEGRARPDGYRKALRAMKLGAKLGLPIITLIDTPGAQADCNSEERGLAGSLAECLANMSSLPTPTISVIIGEGGSGGALALGVSDRILMLENAVYSVISPEGAAAIIYSDASKAADIAPPLKITATDAKSLGVIDVIVPEPEGGAHLDQDLAARLLRRALLRELLEIQKLPVKRLLRERYKKFRHMGQVASVYRTAITTELEEVRGYLQRALEHIRDFLPRKFRSDSGS